MSNYQALRYEQLRLGITNNLKRLDSLDRLYTILVDKDKFITPLQFLECSDLTIDKDLNFEYIKKLNLRFFKWRSFIYKW